MLDEANGTWRYGVETYMYFELPLFGKTDLFSFPLYADSYSYFKSEGGGTNNNPDNNIDNDKFKNCNGATCSL